MPDNVSPMALPIEDYALIGDSATAALVGRDGSVDWLCLPRFDSPACFAALLGDEDNGRWLLGPEGDHTSTRRYLDDTAVLETTFTTASGTVRVLDVMPVADGRADLVRRVVGVEGTVRMRHEWVLRTWYGKITPWVTRGRAHDHDIITAVAGPDRFVLRGSRIPETVDDHHVDTFEVTAGEELTFATTWVPAHRDIPEFLDFDDRITATIARSRRWVSRCGYDGPYRQAVVRSLITLRLMTHGATGGIVAAPTTSLPERFGGVRNWDYRYCWLRDASLTLEALLASGYSSEARLWRDWLLRAVAGDPRDLQIMYAVDGGRDLPERRLDHLPGYAGSRPVRVGNAAVDQKQTDVLGEVMIALQMARELCVPETDDSWALQCTLVEELARHWDEPDHGLWEIRGPRRHFTHSRVMVWVAFDRAVRAVEQHGFEGPVARWRALRDQVHDEILARGYDAARNTFTQHYDTTDVDASLLVLPLVGFVEGDDPRMLGTIDAIEKDLMEDGLLLRYRTETGVDGIPGDEHPFVACSFWLVSAYAKAGRVEEAHRLMRRLLGLLNDVGLLSEEYDPVAVRMAGNFPQAFSHLALVGAAVNLAAADPAQRDPEAEPTDTTSDE
jgi:GH15 family glucan-1,4-alpha-glucosidase